jgi:hypothetical protein
VWGQERSSTSKWRRHGSRTDERTGILLEIIGDLVKVEEIGIYTFPLPTHTHKKRQENGQEKQGYQQENKSINKRTSTSFLWEDERVIFITKVPWVSKQEVIRKREEGEKNSASKAGAPGIPVVVPDKQGLREWWEQCTRQSITENFGEYLTNAEMEMLPSRMFKCLSRTESTGDFIKRNRKNKYRDKRGQK